MADDMGRWEEQPAREWIDKKEETDSGREPAEKNGDTAKDDAVSEILDYYGSLEERSSQENLIAMLRELQEVYGFLSPEMRQRAADTAGVKPAVITCIMKLYKSLKPAYYLHQITVCTGPRCGRANPEILNTVKEELGIQGAIAPSGTLSSDGTVLLETKNCLKRCKTAPNLMIDGKHHGNVSVNQCRELIRSLFKDEIR